MYRGNIFEADLSSNELRGCVKIPNTRRHLSEVLFITNGPTVANQLINGDTSLPVICRDRISK